MNHVQITGLSLAMVLFSNAAWAEETEQVDASDPTKIYSYAGPGYKFTEYSNGDSLSELRAVGNIGFSDNDMLLFEIGYGSYDGTIESGDKEDPEPGRSWAFGPGRGIFHSRRGTRAT